MLQGFLIHRFGNIAIEAHRQTTLFIALHGMGGHHDGGLVAAPLRARLFPNQAQGGLTVHFGHLQVNKEQIPGLLAPARQRFPAVIHHFAPVAEPLQQPPGDFLVHQIVLCQQNVQSTHLCGRLGGGRRRGRSRRGGKDAGNDVIEFAMGNGLMQIMSDPNAFQHIGIKMAAH